MPGPTTSGIPRWTEVVKRRRRFVVVFLAVATGFGLWAAGAVAIFPESNVQTYTGCLTSSSGTLSGIAVGVTPAKPCNANQVVVHLSGGDITAVRTAVGSGLRGGTANGAASLSLDSRNCSNGEVLKWHSAGWNCEADLNTKPELQSIQVRHPEEGFVLVCPQTDPLCPDANEEFSLTAICPEGTVPTGGGYDAFGAVRVRSAHLTPMIEGYTVGFEGTSPTLFGFDRGSAAVYAICLRVK